MKKVLILLLVIILTIISLSAELNQMRIVGRAEKTVDIVPARYRTVNNQNAACIIFITDLEVDLDFRPRVELVALVNPAHGQFHVYVAPNERVIDVHALGYRPLTVVLRDFGISVLESGSVYRLQLTGDRIGVTAADRELFAVRFQLNQEDVYVSHNNNTPVQVSGNTARFRVPAGRNNFTFIKSGFRDETVTLDVEENISRSVNLTKGQTATTFKLPGHIIVNSNPSGGQFYINEQFVGETPHSGRLIAGNYTYSLNMPLYHTAQGNFTLNEGETLNLPLIDLKPQFGMLSIETTPPGANIIINNRSRGQTPSSPIRLESGGYNLELRHEMYHTHQESVTIRDGEEKKLIINLKPAFGELRITSTPESGADVFIDDIKAGTTPYTNNRQPSGRYLVRVEKELWSSSPRHIEIEDNSLTNEAFPLTQNFGTINIVSRDADIYIDNRRVGRNSYEARLSPGRHTITAKKERHIDAAENVFLQARQTERLELEPTPIMGALTVESEPFETLGSEIWIDGKRHMANTPTSMRLLIGDYELRVKREGYGDVVRNVTIRENEETDVKVTLSRTVMVNITSEPSRADIYVSNQKVGTTPANIPLNIGSHRIVLKRDNYSDSNETIAVSPAKKNKFNFTMTPLTTRVTINSEPTRADIYIDGVKVGRTNTTIPIELGRRELVLKRTPDYYNKLSRTIFVTTQVEKLTYKLVVDLEKRKKYLNSFDDKMTSNTILGFISPSSELKYSAKVSLLYMHNHIAVSLPGLSKVAFWIPQKVDPLTSVSRPTVGISFLGDHFYTDSFCGMDWLSLSLGYFYASTSRNLRFSWDIRGGIITIINYDSGRVLETPLLTEMNLELYTGLKSFIVLTGGLMLGFESEKSDDDNVSHFNEVWLPYFGVGIRF